MPSRRINFGPSAYLKIARVDPPTDPWSRSLGDAVSDEDLVRQVLAGRTAAYAVLVRRWSARVLATCHARVRSAHAAEDLAQEALMRGYQGLRSLADPARFGAWLSGIATRTCLDWLKAKPQTEVPFSTLGHDARPAPPADDLESPHEPAADGRDERSRLMAAVEALPDAYCQVVMLYYYSEVTYQELAEMLGVSSATVNARLTKARAMLRERLCGSPGQVST